MTQTFLVAAPYTMPELSELEERHEIGEFIDYEQFDYHGHCGEVLIDGAWHSLWAFGSEAEALRFVSSWGGVLLNKAVQAKVTDCRWLELETIRGLMASQ